MSRMGNEAIRTESTSSTACRVMFRFRLPSRGLGTTFLHIRTIAQAEACGSGEYERSRRLKRAAQGSMNDRAG